ncbi:hypothetical protein L873DRAFT_229563 [Choiromyces venosus 120613-1]|uniref:Uncharacterized protein n=1 Tax=Choiromyces venosus 120613-1 TaxID=1336337 RepID=A0A3N4K1B2_9PEZI|nr:hypothetical protein L873DRAFT_229563 [Choiromyces venosus 120613-1]
MFRLCALALSACYFGNVHIGASIIRATSRLTTHAFFHYDDGSCRLKPGSSWTLNTLEQARILENVIRDIRVEGSIQAFKPTRLMSNTNSSVGGHITHTSRHTKDTQEDPIARLPVSQEPINAIPRDILPH